MRHRDAQADLERGFFARPSTEKYLEELAELPSLAVVAGAGVSADVGTPLWGDLMASLLAALLRDEPEASRLGSEERAVIIDHLAEHYSPAYLASAVRSIIARRPADSENALAKLVES